MPQYLVLVTLYVKIDRQVIRKEDIARRGVA